MKKGTRSSSISSDTFPVIDRLITMHDDLHLQCITNKLQLELYEKIYASMELHQIFEIVFNQISTLIPVESGLVHIMTHKRKAYYFGYNPGDGLFSWEPNDRFGCPVYMQEMITAISGFRAQEPKPEILWHEPLFYAAIRHDSRPMGDCVFRLKKEANQPITIEDTEHIMHVVSRQIGQLLEQKRVLDEKVDNDKVIVFSRLMTSLIHDMRNPISGISGFVQLIEHKSTDETIKRYCRVILESLTQVGMMCSELQAVICGSTLYLQRTNTTLSELLKETVEKMSETFVHGHITVGLDIRDTCAVFADREKLINVIRHILKNAKEAMAEGGHIRIQLFRSRANACIEFGDTGVGMPAHIQAHIFKPFLTYGKVDATGLGMTIAQRIIEEHGGTISVASFLGKGTVVTITLPLAEKEAIR